MAKPEKHKAWLLNSTLKAFSKKEKSISIRVIDDASDIFIGAKVTEDTKPAWTITGDEGKSFIQWILDISKAPAKLSSAPFHNGFIDHGVIGAWSYNFGIIKQAPERYICSITASMTDEEVEAVQAMCREKHYDLDDLFESAAQYDPDELLNSEDEDLNAMFRSQADQRDN